MKSFSSLPKAPHHSGLTPRSASSLLQASSLPSIFNPEARPTSKLQAPVPLLQNILLPNQHHHYQHHYQHQQHHLFHAASASAAFFPTLATVPPQSQTGVAPVDTDMSSDDAYASFLDQANQDTGAGEAESRGGGGGKQLKTADTEVPAPLKELDTYYTSETDEKFEGVALKWEGKGNIDEDSLAKLVGHKASVESMSVKEFDPKGQYKSVISAVEEVGGGNKVQVFRLEMSGARVEYWVVVVGDGRVLGVRAKAVES